MAIRNSAKEFERFQSISLVEVFIDIKASIPSAEMRHG